MGDLFEKVFLFLLSFFGSRFKILLGLVALATISVVSIAGFRARLKSCWSRQSKSQPRAATTNTNQW